MTTTLAREDIVSLVQMVRDVLKRPDLSEDEIVSAVGAWSSHETLDILFGAEELCGVHFSSAEMESVEGFDALLKAIANARARG
ncbi:MAG TPA: hypothetical protein VG943_11895 [Caulobacterales bacterium]|nr:hypothetical protein [Caulobacterales bacterium]